MSENINHTMKEWWNKLPEEEKTIEMLEFSQEEQAYRRGFKHGFALARSATHITQNDINSWVYDVKKTFPPGSQMECKNNEFLQEAIGQQKGKIANG